MLWAAGLTILVAMAVSTGAEGQTPPDLRAALGRASLEPANVTYKSLQALPPVRRGAVAGDLIRRTWAETCPGPSLKMSDLAKDGRSMWGVKCGGRDLAFTLVLPARPEGRAQVLKCRRDERGGSRCSAL